MIDLDHLEALAKAATPGDWKSSELAHIFGGGSIVSDGDGLVVGEGMHSYDAAFIAACDPATVLELIRAARVAASSSGCPVCKHHECYVDPGA